MPSFGNTTANIGERWVIPERNLGSGSQAAWIGSLTDLQRTLVVSDIVQRDNDAPLLKGRVQTTWPVPGKPADRLQDIDLEIECDEKNRFVISAAAGDWHANGNRMAVRGAWTGGNDDTLELSAADASASLLLLSGSAGWLRLDLPPLLTDGAGLLSQFARTRVTLAPLRAAPPAALYTWSCELPDVAVGEIKAPLKSVTLQYKVHVTGVDRGDEERPRCRQMLALDGTLSLDQEYRFSASVPPAGLARFEIEPADPQAAFPGPAAVLKLIGLEAASRDLDLAIGKVPILKGLRVLYVGLDIDLQAKKLRGIEVAGVFTVATCEFGFSLSWPSPTLSIQLSSATPIELGQIASSLLPEMAGLPSALKIDYLNFSVSAAPFSVSSSIGFKDIWQFSAGPVPFKFEALRLDSAFGANLPAEARIATRWTIAGIDLELEAERISRDGKHGWLFQSVAAEEHAIGLDKLVAAAARMLDIVPPDHFPAIEISAIAVTFDTLDKSFALHALVTLAKPLGPFKTSAVALDFSITPDPADKNRKLIRLTLDGDLDVAGTKLRFNADLSNKELKLQASWKDGDAAVPGLIDLVKLIAPDFDTATVPEHIKAALTPAEISFSFESKGPRLVLKGKTKGGQQLGIQVCKSSAGWGIVFGLGYSQPPDVPEFGALIKGITLRNCWLFVSALPDKQRTELGFDDAGLPVKLSDLGKGVAFAAELDINQQQSDAFKNLQKVAPGTNTFRVLGAIMRRDGVTSALLDLEYKGVLKISDGKGGYLEIKDAGLKLEVGSRGFSLNAHGSLEAPLGDQLLVATVSLELSQKALELSGRLADTKGNGFPLFGLKNVRLKEAALVLGIGFVPPSLRLGIAGAMFFRPGQQVPERIAVKFSVTGPVIKPDYFLLDITHIDLVDLIKAIAATRENAGYFPERLLGAEAFSFHWSAINDTLPDGRAIAAGVGFHGLLNIGDWRAFIAFEAGGQAFSARGEMDPIESEGFRLRGTGTGYRMKGYTENNVWRPVSNAQAAALPGSVAITEREVIRPGGPTIIANSDHQPYLAANFEIKLLDLIQVKANILINDSGMEFDLHNEVTGLFYQDFHAHFRKNRELYTKGQFFAGLNVEIPIPLPFVDPVRIRLGIEGRQEITSGSTFRLEFYYGYDILGLRFSGFILDIPYAPKDFGDIVNMVRDNFFKNVVNGIIGQLIKAIFGLKGAALDQPIPARIAIKEPFPEKMTDDNLTWTGLLQEQLDSSERVLRSGPGSLPASAALDRLRETIVEESGAERTRLRAIAESIVEINRDRMTRAHRSLDQRIAELETQLARRGDRKREVRARLKKLWEANQDAWQEKFRALMDEGARSDMTAETFRQKADALADAFFRKIVKQAAPLKKKYGSGTIRHYFDLLRIDKESRFRSAYVMKTARRKATGVPKKAPRAAAPAQIITVRLNPVRQ